MHLLQVDSLQGSVRAALFVQSIIEMPAHGNCEDALASVAAFAAAVRDEQQSRKLKEKKSKSKHQAKGKERSKEKKHKHKHAKDTGKKSVRAPSSSESDSGDSDSQQGTLEEQLARSRTAVRATRELVGRWPSLKNELREVWYPEHLHMQLTACLCALL